VKEILERKPKEKRLRFYERFPIALTMAKKYIEDRGAAASDKRRSTDRKAVGSDPNDIAEEISSIVPEIKMFYPKFSGSSIRRLCLPPNKRRKASKLYYGVIKARIGYGRNDLHKMNKSVIISRIYFLFFIKIK
jgi:hypothetical protein